VSSPRVAAPRVGRGDLVDSLPYRPLKPEYRKLLEDGIMPTRSRAKEPVPKAYAGLILHMIWRGWGLTEIMAALLDAGNEASEPFLAMERFAARRKIQAIHIAKRLLVEAELLRRDPHGVAEELLRWRNEVLPHLVGRGAAQDRAVITEVVNVGMTLHTWTPPMSSRTLGDRVGLHRKAATLCLHRLERTGVLNLDDSTELGTVIRLSRMWPSTLHGAAPYKELGHIRETVVVKHHPLWSDHGLGHNAGIIWTALDESHDVAELVDMTGLSKTTLYKGSALLERHQLVERHGTLRARTNRTLDAVDEALGASLGLARRAQQNQREQREWWAWSTAQQQQSLIDRQRALDWKRAQAAAQRERIETQVRRLQGVRPATGRSHPSSSTDDPASTARVREAETRKGCGEAMSNECPDLAATSNVRPPSG
jgi:hypothetical protein